MNGALNFTAQDYQQTGNTNYLNASVINQGKITTDTLGSVYLLASQCPKRWDHSDDYRADRPGGGECCGLSSMHA